MGYSRSDADDLADRREVAAEVLADLSEEIWFWLMKPRKEEDDADKHHTDRSR